MKYLKGKLFDHRTVLLSSRVLEVGGSWCQTKNGQIISWGNGLVKLFFRFSRFIPDPVVFDIGSSTGSFLLLAKFMPSMRVFAFEPQPVVFSILKDNIYLNNLESRVKAFPLALSDRVGTAELHVPAKSDRSGLSTLGKPNRFRNARKIQVKINTLDEFFRQQKLKRINMIKIDTEGAELMVLRGGEKTIRKYMPLILVEANGRNTKQLGYDFKEIIDQLRGWGYDTHKVSSEDYLCVQKSLKNRVLFKIRKFL